MLSATAGGINDMFGGKETTTELVKLARVFSQAVKLTPKTKRVSLLCKKTLFFHSKLVPGRALISQHLPADFIFCITNVGRL